MTPAGHLDDALPLTEASPGQPPARSLFKNILQGSSLYSVALIGQRLAGIILLPINTRFLMPADYAVLDLVEQIYSVLAMLLGASFSSAMAYFYVEKTDGTGKSQDNVVATTILGSGLIGVLGATAGIIASHKIAVAMLGNASLTPYLRLIFAFMPLSFMVEALFSWLRVENRPVIFVTVSLLRIALIVCGTVVLVAILKLRVIGVLISNLISLIVLGAVLLIYCFRRIRPVFDPALFRRMARFAFPLGLSGIALFVINFGDRFLLPRYRGFAELGIYALAYKIGLLITFVHSSFFTYWNAQVFQIARREDADSVFARVFTYLVLGSSFTALGLVVFAHPVIRILTTPAYQAAASIVPLIVSAYYVRAIGDFFRCFFMVASRSGYDAVCNWVGSAVCLIGYFALIPRFGMWGAGIATLVSFLTIAVVAIAWTRKLRPMHFESIRLVKVQGVTLALLLAYFFVPVNSLAGQIAWGAVLSLAFPALLWGLRFPTPAERQLTESKLRFAMSLAGRGRS